MTAKQELAIAESVYEKLLRKCYRFEDLIRSRRNPEKAIVWTIPKKRNPSTKKYVELFEWVVHLHLMPFVFRFLAICCGFVSLTIVASEVLFWTTQKWPTVDLSLISLMVNADNVRSSFNGRMILSFLPVFYMALCAYWSFFQVKVSTYFRLVPSATDAYSLLYSASYLCRLGAPLAYNFSLLIHDKNTQFSVVMGDITITPLVGSEFNLYFPMLLLILFIASFFEIYSRVVNMFRRPDAIDKDLETGQHVIALERELYLKAQRIELPDWAFEKIPMTEIELEFSVPWRQPTKRSDTVSKSIQEIKSRYSRTGASSPSTDLSSFKNSQQKSTASSIRETLKSKFSKKDETSMELLDKGSSV